MVEISDKKKGSINAVSAALELFAFAGMFAR